MWLQARVPPPAWWGYGPVRLSATIWQSWMPYGDTHDRQNVVGEMERDVGTAPTPAGW
jgi:hypothetical protein